MSHEMWERRYAEAADARTGVWSADPNAWLEETVGGLTAGAAVDLGAGEGRHTLWLASLGWRAIAVDFAGAGLATAARRAATAGLDIETVEADVTAWAPPEPVDLIVAAYLQLDRPVLEAVLLRMGAALAPGGRLVVIGHDLDNLHAGTGGPSKPEILHTEESLRRGAGGLRVEQLGRTLRPVEGVDRPAIDTVLVATRPA